MTVRQLIQLCRLEFPNAGETELLNDINITCSDFLNATGIYSKSKSIDANGYIYQLSDYISDIDGVNRNLIKQIYFYDSNNQLLDENISVQVINDKLIFYDDYKVKRIPAGCSRIVIDYIAKAPTLTIDDDLDILPVRFHVYIQYGVLAKLYMRYPTIEKIYPDNARALVRDIQMINYYLQLYEKGKIEARRYSRINPLLPTRQLRTDET